MDNEERGWKIAATTAYVILILAGVGIALALLQVDLAPLFSKGAEVSNSYASDYVIVTPMTFAVIVAVIIAAATWAAIWKRLTGSELDHCGMTEDFDFLSSDDEPKKKGAEKDAD
jgi:hypothetical protein